MHQTDYCYGVNASGSTISYDLVGYYFDKRKDEDINKDIENIRGFYLVDEIPFKDIKEGDIDVDLKGKLGDNLPLQTLLPASAFVNKETVGGTPYVYNSRNHLFNYSDKQVYGFNINQARQVGGNAQFNDTNVNTFNYQVRATIKSLQLGDYTVISDLMESNISMFNGYITYPDSSASEITIARSDGIEKHFIMKPSKSGGYSYCLDSLSGFYFSNNPQVGGVTEPLSPIFSQGNQIKVSEIYFSYSFPPNAVYTLGNGTIIGLASLSVPLSQDTFGQYPLLVFCTDGIYSMNVDITGSGVYTNVPPPFSREVCINRNSICELDGAVLFASNKGLMIATSQGVQEFVPNLNGEPKHKPDAKEMHGLGLELYGRAIDNEQVTTLINHIDMSDFREYVSDPNTYVTYASEKNKVMIYNGNKPYVYWIDIPTRNATKLPVSIKMDNNDYPTELYVQSDNHMMEFKQLSANVNTQTMFQTRPIKLDGGMKTAMRVIVRGYFNSNEADKWAVLLVLGSYDGINWQPLGLKQKPLDGGFNDLGCVVDRVSHKYMMVIFSASLNRDSHIDGIELTKRNKYNNKLK